MVLNSKFEAANLEYKYLILSQGSKITKWESGDNRKLDLSAFYEKSNDDFELLIEVKNFLVIRLPKNIEYSNFESELGIRKIKARLSLLHPFMSSFGTEDIQPFIRLSIIYALSESAAYMSGGSPRTVRKYLNKFLLTALGR